MHQLSLPFAWWEADWTDDGPPSTVSRPTEDAALRNIRQAQKAMTGRRDLEPLERIVYELELLAIREHPRLMTPEMRAAWIARHGRVSIYNLTTPDVMALLDDVSRVLEYNAGAAPEPEAIPVHRVLIMP